MDLDIRRGDDRIPDKNDGGDRIGVDRGGDSDTMEDESRPIKLESTHGGATAPRGNPLRFFCFE